MKRYIRYCLIALSLPIVLTGTFFLQFNVILIGILFLLAANVLFSFERIKQRIIFLLFNGTMTLFLLGRPIAKMMIGQTWWIFSIESVLFALFSIYLTLFFLYIGTLLAEWMIQHHPMTPNRSFMQPNYRQFLQILQQIAFWITMFTFIFYFAGEWEKWLFMRGKEYEEFYISFTTQMPAIFRLIIGLYRPSLCLFLATMPKKKKALLPLILFILTSIPSLLIGIRNPLVLNTMFVFLYYYIRHVIDGEQHGEKWFGIKEKLILLVTTPSAVILLSLYNYIRSGLSTAGMTLWFTLFSFIDKQGVSFDVLCRTAQVFPKIQSLGYRVYTIGPFLDYLTNNTFISMLLNKPVIANVNSIEKALSSFSLSHRLSFAVLGEEYLAGHGLGSSFILNAYLDFGIIGILLTGILLGVLMAYMIPLIKRNWIWATMILMGLTSLFFTPRAETFDWLSSLVTPHFWFTVILCYVLARLCSKNYSLKKPLANQWNKSLY